MKPVFICQLPDEMQEELREIFTRILLFECGTREKAEEYFGLGFEDEIQICMDLKIVEIGCVTDDFNDGFYLGEEVPENIKEDMERLMEIIRRSEEIETDRPFLFYASEQIDGSEYYELVNVLWHHGEDDYSLWQVQLPIYLVRNILNSSKSFTGDVDEIMDGVPMKQGVFDNALHFLFPRGGKIACCSMKMDEKFYKEYSICGTSVRGNRADIRGNLAACLVTEETFQEER